jgi:hypothetical protein
MFKELKKKLLVNLLVVKVKRMSITIITRLLLTIAVVVS